MSPVIVGYDQQSESFWATIAKAKGVNESSLKWTKERIDESGYFGTKVTEEAPFLLIGSPPCT